MKRAALYVRVSTEEQRKHGISVDSQINALRQYCSENELLEVGLYNDAGHSARKKYTTRPALMRLLDDCRSGKIDVIIFTKLDRWFRSVSDYHAVQSVLEETHVTWRCIWEDYETETPSGIFKVNIMLSVAQNEADNARARVRAVKDYQRAQGKFVGGRAPLGYRFDHGDLIVDEDTRNCVADFFGTYLATANMAAAIRVLERYGHKMSRRSATLLLEADYYRGEHKGYKCYAYLTPEMSKAIDNIRENNYRITSKPPSKIYLFSGLIRCADCGCRYGGVPHLSRGKCKDGFRSYHSQTYQCVSYKMRTGCSNTRTVFQSTLEKYLLQNLESLLAEARAEYQLIPKDTIDTAAEKKKLEAKLQRIGARFEEGDISLEEYREKRDNIKVEIAKLKVEAPKAVPELPADWKEVYNTLDVEHKRAFWHSVVKRIEVHSNSSDFNVIFL